MNRRLFALFAVTLVVMSTIAFTGCTTVKKQPTVNLVPPTPTKVGQQDLIPLGAIPAVSLDRALKHGGAFVDLGNPAVYAMPKGPDLGMLGKSMLEVMRYADITRIDNENGTTVDEHGREIHYRMLYFHLKSISDKSDRSW